MGKIRWRLFTWNLDDAFTPHWLLEFQSSIIVCGHVVKRIDTVVGDWNRKWRENERKPETNELSTP